MKTQTRIGLAVGLTLALLAGLAPRAGAVSATGGNYTNDIPGYRIHVFTNSATASNLVVTTGGSVEVVVVAGGGGGGWGYGGAGGGGAGGLVYHSTYSVTDGQVVPVTVGDGGAGSDSGSGATRKSGNNGTNSVFGSITAVGGGGGSGNSSAISGVNGGSGGGGGCGGGGGTTTQGNSGGGTGYGNNGGGSTGAANAAGGGGGGAGAQGTTGTTTGSAPGGDGRYFAHFANAGSPSGWFSGGGGGGGGAGGNTGGKGGGGAGGYSPTHTGLAGSDAVANTGGGGGGADDGYTAGGKGGSGIVIVGYAVPNAWTYSMPITFTNDTRLNTLTNFPALVIFDTNKVTYSQFLANGQDLRFMDGNGAELAYEVETWNTSSNSYIWVQIPTMTAGCVITAYWGNASATLPAYRTNGTAWADGYVGVWHLPDGTTLSAQDSSPRRNNSTAITTPTATAGKIGGAANFSTTYNDYINFGNVADYTFERTNPFSVEAWIHGVDTTGGDIVSKDLTASPYTGWNLMCYHRTPGTGTAIELDLNSTSSGWIGVSTPQNSIAPNNWYHVVATYNGSSASSGVQLYINGALQTLERKGDLSIANSIQSAAKFTFGTRDANTTWISGHGNAYAGKRDEVRVSSVVRSANWVWACYANQSSPAAFSTYGTVVASSAYKLKMAFSNYTAAEVLTNFPVLVTFSNGLYGTFNYNTFTSPTNGGDLRFTDSSESTFLDFEIEKWDTNGASFAWVRVPQLSSNTTIYAKWGGSDTNLPACTTNGAVWTNGYESVWHFDESASPYKDSTLKHDATAGAAPSRTTSAMVCAAQSFGGSSYLTAGAVNLGNLFTLSAWVNVDSSASSIQTILGTKVGGGSSDGMVFNVNTWNTTDKKLIFETGNGSSGTQAVTPINLVPYSLWHHVVVVVDRTSGVGTLYVDGADCTSVNSVNTTFGNNKTLYIGQFADNTFRFKGIMDELRVSTVARSTNWVWAEYANIA